MTDHSRHQQNENQTRQQPDGTDDQIARQCQINPADSNESKNRLPPRLRFIDVIVLIRNLKCR